MFRCLEAEVSILVGVDDVGELDAGFGGLLEVRQDSSALSQCLFQYRFGVDVVTLMGWQGQ